jgi:hypothetical protein
LVFPCMSHDMDMFLSSKQPRYFIHVNGASSDCPSLSIVSFNEVFIYVLRWQDYIIPGFFLEHVFDSQTSVKRKASKIKR